MAPITFPLRPTANREPLITNSTTTTTTTAANAPAKPITPHPTSPLTSVPQSRPAKPTPPLNYTPAPTVVATTAPQNATAPNASPAKPTSPPPHFAKPTTSPPTNATLLPSARALRQSMPQPVASIRPPHPLFYPDQQPRCKTPPVRQRLRLELLYGIPPGSPTIFAWKLRHRRPSRTLHSRPTRGYHRPRHTRACAHHIPDTTEPQSPPQHSRSNPQPLPSPRQPCNRSISSCTGQ